MAVSGFNHFTQIALNLHKATAPMVAHTAQYIAETYAASAARDTGFMADSAYYVTAEGSTYGQAGAPPGDSYLLPEVAGPANDQEAYAAVAANYAGFVELGHHTRGGGSWVPAQPAWYPSVDLAAGEFEAQGAKFEATIAELI